MPAETLWDRVDERVLRWVFGLPATLQQGEIFTFETREPAPFEAIEGLDTREVARALRRLHSHGLIAAGNSASGAGDEWWELRLTPAGLIVLGEWPDLDRIATAASVHGILHRLSDEASPEDRDALRRAAGLVSRTADAVVRGTAADVASSAAREALE